MMALEEKFEITLDEEGEWTGGGGTGFVCGLIVGEHSLSLCWVGWDELFGSFVGWSLVSTVCLPSNEPDSI